MKTQFISEIGINHNGSLDLAKKLIEESKKAGCQYVKIQKRNPDVCVPEHQKTKPKSTPWGDMTYLEYKYRVEFNEEQVRELYYYSKNIGINFFASVWDKDSVDVMASITDIGKIPSALITDLELCKYAREKFNFLIISTGMSTEDEIDLCIKVCNPDVIMHSNSTYPCPPEELNLRYIQHLQKKYPNKEIGYSGHEQVLSTTCASIVLGATWIERHVTLDKNMWGSDQSSSIDLPELNELITSINHVEQSLRFPPGKRILFEGELKKRDTLRKSTTDNKKTL
jgi:N-acetylneuraminate synthase